MMQKKTVYIVSHTHWDREWYAGFEAYRTRLLDVIDQVLTLLENDDGFEHFVLDGQAVILEDFLEILPQARSRIERLVRAKKLSIGPWYILPDEFLVDGEATIRNLMIGYEICEELGRVQKVGYLPDSFGHIAQMPQILKQAGIDSFIYTRGNGNELAELGAEFFWQGPDGSRVLAVYQIGGYCNASGLGYSDIQEVINQKRAFNQHLIKEQVDILLKKSADFATTNLYLFNNGCDHYPPQSNFNQLLTFLRQKYKNMNFVHSSFESYIKNIRPEVPEHRIFHGEMIRGRYHHILPGVWSARMYLKQANFRCQKLLEFYLEPLWTYLYFIKSVVYPLNLITHFWKLLLKNHPHDSICGCSIDQVHRDNMSRFNQIEDGARQSLQLALNEIAPEYGLIKEDDKNLLLVVFNPLVFKRNAVLEKYLVLPPDFRPADLTLVDENDNPVSCSITEMIDFPDYWGVDLKNKLFITDQEELIHIYKNKYAQDFAAGSKKPEKYHVCKLQFMVENLPALCHRYFYLKAGKRSAAGRPVKVNKDSIENQFCRIRIYRNGSFDYFDKVNNIKFAGLNRFEDTEDAGDEYDYAPCLYTETCFTENCRGVLSITESTPFKATVAVSFGFELPSALTSDRQARKDDKVSCRLKTTLTLYAEDPVVYIETTFNNLVRDHRLRVHFPSRIISNTLQSDGHFLLNSRPVDQPEGGDWVQAPAGPYPQQDFSVISDSNSALAVFNRGLPEIEALPNDRGELTLALTLLRCVEWLSREDLSTRKGNAGPMLFTPEAQCAGEHVFEYALLGGEPHRLFDRLKTLSLQYKVAPLVMQGVVFPGQTIGKSLLTIDSDDVAVTAVKRHKRHDSLVGRLYNKRNQKVKIVVTCGIPIKAAWRLNVLETRQKQINVVAESILLSLKPHEISTIEIEPARP